MQNIVTPFLSNQGVLSYLIQYAEDRAALIDPSFDSAQEILKYLKVNNITLTHILETHTHADFLSSRALFKKLFEDVSVLMSENSRTKDKDKSLKDGQRIVLKNITITAYYTPGHTNDSMSYFLKSSNTQDCAIFTGDTLLIGGTGRTDFQQGSSQNLYNSLTKLLELKDTTVVYPGHNYKGQVRSTIGVEKLTNKRLSLVHNSKKADFIKLMDSHKPPVPDLFEESLKWNSF